MNALTNSVRKTALAAWSSFISGRPRKPMSMSHARAPAGELENPGHEDDHAKRDRQKYFPAKPHQLIVAISWHEGFHHGDQEKDQANLHTAPGAAVKGENGTGDSQPPRNRIVVSA
jgi:hypothetical protein